MIICWLQILVWITFLLLPFTSKRTEAGPVRPKTPGLKGAMSSLGSSIGSGSIKPGMALLSRFQRAPVSKGKPPVRAGSKKPVGMGMGKPRNMPYVPLKEEGLPARSDQDGLPVYDFEPGRFCNFSGDNRMVVLLFWDLLCFVGVGSLYVCSLMYLSENPNILSAADPFAFSCDAYALGCDGVGGGNASGNAFGNASGNASDASPESAFETTRDMDPWTNWQAQITLHVCRVLFSISSLPFLFFMVPFLRTIFTHTSPTGYTKRGECVLLNTQGLTGFLSWLKDMLARRSTRSKLLHADATLLRRAIREGELLLDKHPFSKKLHAKQLRVTMELLQQTINYRHPLYVEFFPDDVLTREFEKNLAEQVLE